MARLERNEDRYKISSDHPTLQYSTQPYERSHKSYAYGRSSLYGPGVPGSEVEHQPVVGDTPARYPLGETSSIRPQPIQPSYGGYHVSSATHSLYPVAPATPISPTWHDQPTQYEGGTPPQPGPAPGHPHLPSQPMYEYERERHPQPWTSSPSHVPASRPVSSYEASPSYAQTHAQHRVNTLPPDSTLLTPLPGYQPSSTTLEPEYDEEYDSKQQFWAEQQH